MCNQFMTLIHQGWSYYCYTLPLRKSIVTTTSYLSAFSPNPGKYEPEKTLYLHNFYTVAIINKNTAKQEMLRNLTIAMILG